LSGGRDKSISDLAQPLQNEKYARGHTSHFARTIQSTKRVEAGLDRMPKYKFLDLDLTLADMVLKVF